MLKRLLALILLFVFAFGLVSMLPETVQAAKKPAKQRVLRRRKAVRKVKKTRSRRFYRSKRKYFRTYKEYFLTPRITQSDRGRIVKSLRSDGVDSVRFDEANNSLILQFQSQKVNAVDLLRSLKDLGYTVTSIN
jgi:hypothetical protein